MSYQSPKDTQDYIAELIKLKSTDHNRVMLNLKRFNLGAVQEMSSLISYNADYRDNDASLNKNGKRKHHNRQRYTSHQDPNNNNYFASKQHQPQNH